MMVTLSMGVLQCNLFANVSTVAGEPHFDSLCGSRLGLGPLGPSGQLQRSSIPVGQWADLPTTQGSNTGLHCHPDLGPHSMLMGLREATASASESHFCSHISGQDRHIPQQAFKEPGGSVAPGQEKVQRGGSEVYSRSSVQPVATSELMNG